MSLIARSTASSAWCSSHFIWGSPPRRSRFQRALRRSDSACKYEGWACARGESGGGGAGGGGGGGAGAAVVSVVAWTVHAETDPKVATTSSAASEVRAKTAI